CDDRAPRALARPRSGHVSRARLARSCRRTSTRQIAEPIRARTTDRRRPALYGRRRRTRPQPPEPVARNVRLPRGLAYVRYRRRCMPLRPCASPRADLIAFWRSRTAYFFGWVGSVAGATEETA